MKMMFHFIQRGWEGTSIANSGSLSPRSNRSCCIVLAAELLQPVHQSPLSDSTAPWQGPPSHWIQSRNSIPLGLAVSRADCHVPFPGTFVAVPAHRRQNTSPALAGSHRSDLSRLSGVRRPLGLEGMARLSGRRRALGIIARPDVRNYDGRLRSLLLSASAAAPITRTGNGKFER